MSDRISFESDDVVVEDYCSFENIRILSIQSPDGQQLRKQLIDDYKLVNTISEYAKSDGLSICNLLVRYEKYKKIAQRVKSEHSKFAKLGFEGLQQNGKSQLHMLNFLLTGKLPHEMKYSFCKKRCGRRTDTDDMICRMCRGFVN